MNLSSNVEVKLIKKIYNLPFVLNIEPTDRYIHVLAFLNFMNLYAYTKEELLCCQVLPENEGSRGYFDFTSSI